MALGHELIRVIVYRCTIHFDLTYKLHVRIMLILPY